VTDLRVSGREVAIGQSLTEPSFVSSNRSASPAHAAGSEGECCLPSASAPARHIEDAVRGSPASWLWVGPAHRAIAGNALAVRGVDTVVMCGEHGAASQERVSASAARSWLRLSTRQ
jgi:hypothetical protein